MNHKVLLSLAVSLFATSAVSAQQVDTNSDAATPRAVRVPNIPPELSTPAPPSPFSGGDNSADLAGPATGLQDDTPQPRVSATPADTCDTADCLGSGGATAAATGKKPNGPVSVPIGKPAQRALAESHAWAENPAAMPLRDSGGRVIFSFSESAPTIVCAPLKVCDIELQPGEVVQGAPHIGDSIRWKVAPAVSGSEDRKVTHLIVKPTESGLDTNLVIPTDRHTYHIRLVSSAALYVASVAFDYPDEQQQAWHNLTRSTSNPDAAVGSGEMPTVAVNRLNFDYKIKVVKGKPSFRPLRAMDDGYHTYIAMNEDLPQAEAPALVGISASGEEQMINYRLKGNIYVIDGTVTKLALISGVGKKQQRVELTRSPCQKRGWLGICWDPKE
jgi:P-type conjugative transfer protein TrbG